MSIFGSLIALLEAEEAEKRRRAKDTRADYMSQHRRRITKGERVNLDNLTPGDIVTFHYRGKVVHTPRPIVLVLNKNWHGYLHGVALRHVSEPAFNHLLKTVIKFNASRSFLMHNLRTIIKLPVDIPDPKEFYNQRIKPFMRRYTSDSPYRTYTVGGITALRLVNYNFKLGRKAEVEKHITS